MKYEKGAFVTLPNIEALRKLSLGARVVFTEICVYADERGQCFPKRKLLADNIQMSMDSVDRFIVELETAGLLTKTKRNREDGSLTSNLYQIMVLPLGSRTHAPTPSRTHATAELNPLRTKPTVTETSSEYKIVSSLEEEEKRKTPPKYPNAPAVLKLFKIIGNVPANWKINTAQLKACENLFKERGLEKIESALEFYSETKEVEFCPQITTPFDLDSKWTKLGQFKLKQ